MGWGTMGGGDIRGFQGPPNPCVFPAPLGPGLELPDIFWHRFFFS